MSNIPALLFFNLKKKGSKRKLAIFVIAGLFLFLSTLGASAKVINLGTSVDDIYVQGNLGVGTSAPSVDLEVLGQGKFSSGVRIGTQFISNSVYSHSNGLLVTTDIGVDDNAMIELYIEGNSYSGWGNIGGRVQAYNYVTTGTIIQTSYVSYGITPTEVRVFHQDGVVKFWMSQINNFQTFRFKLGTNTGSFRITGISDAVMPTTGVTNEVVLTPKTVLNNNLGVGTSNPTTKLDVTGTFRSTLSTTHSLLGGAGNAVVMSDNTGALYSTGLDTFLSSNTLWSGTRNGNIWNGDSGTGNVGIGTTAPAQQLDITKNFRLLETSGITPYGIIYKGANPFIHDFNYGDNGVVTTNGNNTFVGINTGNFTMGSTATDSSHSSYNTGVGYGVLSSLTTGRYNSGIGWTALRGVTSGSGNLAFGHGAGNSITSGSNNTTFGFNSLSGMVSGSDNLAIGFQAGRYTSVGTTPNDVGNNGIFIGANTKPLNASGNNEIVIGANTIGLGSNTIVLGNNSVVTTALKGSVGIGTTSPGAKLHISEGSNSIINLVPTLFSDAGTKEYAGEFTGNGDISGILITNQKTDGSGYPFLQLYNKTLNDSWMMRMLPNDTYSIAEGWSPDLDRFVIASGGNVGIGTTDPGHKLEVYNTSSDIYSTSTEVLPDQVIYKRNNSGLANEHASLGFLTTSNGGVNHSAAQISLIQPTSGSTDSDLAFKVRDDYGYVTEVMRLNYMGNMGIGTDDPEAKLHISEGSNSIINLVPTLFSDAGTKEYAGEFTGNGDISGILITNQKADGSGYPFLQFYNKTLNDSWMMRMLPNDTYSIAEGWSPDLDRFVIASGGNVGIGTTNPEFELDLEGSLRTRSAHHTMLGGVGNVILASDNEGTLYTTDLTMLGLALSMNTGVIRKYRVHDDTNATAGDRDYIIRFTNLTTNRALFLEDSMCTAGRTYVVSNDENATNSLQIWPTSPTTINGQAYFSVGTSETATVYCDGANWVAY